MKTLLNNLKLALLLGIFCLGLFSGSNVYGQIPGSEPLVLNFTPENPRPGQMVSFRLESFLTDLNSATISWLVNNKLQKRGVGEMSFNFTAPKIGDTSTISVTVKTLSGEIFNKSQTIRPTSVDLVWEADTYTPPFYRGKALFSHQSTVKIVALPHLMAASGGSELSPAKLIYTWSKNGTVLGDNSGYGKQTLTIVGPTIIRPVQVSVTATSPDGQLSASGGTNLESISPAILFYEDSPFLGKKFHQVVESPLVLSEDELTLTAVPYFFSLNNKNSGALSFKWRVNGESVPEETGESVTFRRESGGGQATVGLTVENKARIFQFGRANTVVDLGQEISAQNGQ